MNLGQVSKIARLALNGSFD